MYTRLIRFTGVLIYRAIVVIALYSLTPVFFYIPKASLGAIIMMSVVHMVSVDEVKRIARVNPLDLLVWATSFFACLFWYNDFDINLTHFSSLASTKGVTTQCRFAWFTPRCSLIRAN